MPGLLGTLSQHATFVRKLGGRKYSKSGMHRFIATTRRTTIPGTLWASQHALAVRHAGSCSLEVRRRPKIAILSAPPPMSPFAFRSLGRGGAFRRRGPPPAEAYTARPKMAAEVDFGDRELFEQLDSDEPATVPAAQPLHTRFEWEDDGGEDDGEEGGGAERAEADEETAKLRERLRECEEAVRQLQAENILLPPPRLRALARGRRGRAGRAIKGFALPCLHLGALQ